MPRGRVGSMRKEDAAYRRHLKAEAKREKAQWAALRRADARAAARNPALKIDDKIFHEGQLYVPPGTTAALKPVRKSTGWMNGPANTQIKFKKNPGGATEVYIRRKARKNSASGAKKAREYHAEKMRKTGRYNTGYHRNVGGFVDANGEFHPIRDSEGYDYAGVIAKKKRAARKRAPAKRKTTKRRTR